VSRGFSEGADEPVSVLLELADFGLDAARDLVDGHEEGQLTLAEGVEDLAVATCDFEDRHPIGDELDFGQVLVERRTFVQVLPRAPYPL
jgi:hypothetical protein